MDVILPILSVVVMFLVVILRHWFLDYRYPKWRQHRWQNVQNSVIHYDPWWQPWYAWRPVRTVSGQVVWLDTVYRCIGNDYVDHEDWRWYYYGNTFDILRNPG